MLRDLRFFSVSSVFGSARHAEKRMKATQDPALGAFLNRDDPAKIDEFIGEQKARGRR